MLANSDPKDPIRLLHTVLKNVRQWHENTIRSGQGQIRLMQSLCRYSAPACQRLYVATSEWIGEQRGDRFDHGSCPYCGTPLGRMPAKVHDSPQKAGSP